MAEHHALDEVCVKRAEEHGQRITTIENIGANNIRRLDAHDKEFENVYRLFEKFEANQQKLTETIMKGYIAKQTVYTMNALYAAVGALVVWAVTH